MVADVLAYLRERVHARTTEYRKNAAAPHVGTRRKRQAAQTAPPASRFKERKRERGQREAP